MAKKQSYLKKKQTFSGAQVLLFVLIFAAVGAVAIWQSLAAPHNDGGGKPGGNGTIALSLVTDANGDGLPNWGDTITFNVSTTATTEPHVSVACYQNNVLVYSATTGYYSWYPWPWTNNLQLKSTAWASGAADCNARLYMVTTNGHKSGTSNLATMSFHVNS